LCGEIDAQQLEAIKAASPRQYAAGSDVDNDRYDALEKRVTELEESLQKLLAVDS
jgi:uncharacterized protein YceH (UPF0502 family)